MLLMGFLSRLLGGTSDEQTQHLASEFQLFVEALSDVAHQDDIIKITLKYLDDTLKAKRAGLILITYFEGKSASQQHIRLAPHAISLGDVPTNVGSLQPNSPFYQRFAVDRLPLLKAEIDQNPQFASAPPSEQLFFAQMDMLAYVPIVAQSQTLGLLCAGARRGSGGYTAAELSLMATIAKQSGIALRNTRLVEDLRRREKESLEANNALKRAKEQLEQLDSVKTDFVTIASHELRTPLAQVRGYTDIIEALNTQGMLDPEQLTSMTANLRKATDRMEELIRNMLDVSQLDVNAMDLRFTNIKVDNVVRMAIEPITESIRNRRQSLTARGLRGLPEIEADMKRLVQAFQNVIVNAVKFTPDEGRIEIEGQMRVNPETGREEILITIKDSGIGIDEKNQEIIFEKFVRTQDPSLHSTGKTKFMGAGPGLGLTIARGVINGHGGRIWVESSGFNPEAMPGSTFYIVLPVELPEDATRTLNFDNSAAMSKAEREKLRGEMAKLEKTKS